MKKYPKGKPLNVDEWNRERMMQTRPITSGWGSIKYPTSKEQFKHYCEEQIKSLKVAIDRKSKGSSVEDGYFMEHLNKLKDFFMNHYVEE